MVTEEPYDDDDLVDIEDEEEEAEEGKNLLANAAKAALNLTDPLSARPTGEAEKTKKALNKSADWPSKL